MKESNEKGIISLIDEAKTIGFVTHVDGDGDAFGSMLGLARIVEMLGKKAYVFSNESLNYTYDFIKEDISYNPLSVYRPVELLIGLDANSFARFTIPDLFKMAKRDGAKLAIVDHHERSDIGEKVDFYWGDPSISSASEMVYLIAKEMKIKLDKTTATLILLGIETDTFSLQFENSKPEVFLAVAELLKQGARLKPIVESAFGGKPLPMVLLLGRVMDRVRLYKGDIAVSYVTIKDKLELGLTENASSGVANFLDQIKEAKVTMLFEEVGDNLVKVSLRSNGSNADVAHFASFFGGGGHKKAAGFHFKADLSKLIPYIKGINS